MARSLLLALLVVIAATCAITVQAESDPASVGFSSDHAALSTYAAAASVRAGKMAAEFGKLAEQSIADGEAHAAKERKIRKAEADYAKSVADKKARDAAKRAARAARAARIAATRTRTFALSFDAPIATFTAEARTAIIADVSKLMGVDAGRVSIVKMAPTRADAQKTRIRFKVLAASAFKAPAAAPAKAAKAAKPKPKKAAKPTFQAPKPGKLGRRKGQQKLGVFVKPAAAAAPAPKKPAAQTPLAKSTKRALQSLAAALKAGAKADALKANKVNAASLNQQTKAERAAARAAKAAARVARRAAIKKSLVEFKLTRKNAKLALVKSLDAAKKSKADRAAALKAFNKETRKLRRALRRSLRGDRKRDPALRKLLQAFRVKAKDARRALRATLAARPAKERKTKLRDLRRTQAQQRKDIIARFRRERKTARKQARKAAKAEIRTTKVAAAAVKAAATAAAAPAAPKSSFMELLSQQDAEVPEWPAHNRRDNVGERVRILASGKPRQYKQRDASQAKYIKLLPKHTAAESYAEHFQEWTRPKPAVTRRTVAQIKRKKFLGAAKKKPAATKPIVPKLAPLPAPAAVVPVPQSLTPAAAKTAAKSSVPQTATVEAKSVSWWSPWHICIVVMSGIAFMGLVAGLAVWIRRNKSDRAPQELYAAV